MPMTKAQAAEMNALRDELALVRALRWTEAVQPDVPPPSHEAPGGPLSAGWLPVAEQSDRPRVEQACSSAFVHRIGRVELGSYGSQGSVSLYSTRLLALRGLRHQVERHVAGILARIDVMIEKEVEP